MAERCNAALYGQVCKQPAGHAGTHSDGFGNHWLTPMSDGDVVEVLKVLGEFIEGGYTAGTGTAGERLVQAYRDYLTRH